MDKAQIEQHFTGHFQEFFSKYLPNGVKRIGGDEYQALCPFHDDKKPSFSINAQTGLYFCHGCQKKGSWAHFYAKKHGLDDRRDFRLILDGICRDFNLNSDSAPKERPQLVKAYDYVDERDTLLYQVCRLNPKGFTQRRPNGNGGWEYKLDGTPRVPYRLPELIKAPEIIIAEGEKDCDNLAALGFTATTNPGGAGKWRKEYGTYCTGKSVIIVPDNDEPGRKHAKAVAAALYGIAKDIKIVTLPDLPPAGDVSDFIARFGKPDEAVEALSKIIADAPVYKPEQAYIAKNQPRPSNPLPCARTCEDLRKLYSRTLRWIWRQHIPGGMPVMVNGREGTGKTTICLGMAKETLETHEQGIVVWVACEGQLANTLGQAEAMRLAENPRFRIAELAPGDYLFRFDRPDHLKKFSELISSLEREAPVLAVFIDSIRGMTGFGDNDSEVGNVMMAVNSAVCDRHGSSLVYIDHWKKGRTQGDHSLLDKAVGSTAKTSAVRLVLSVLPVSKLKRALKEAKNNIGTPVPELEVFKSPSGRIIFQESRQATEQSLRDQAEELLFSMFSERQRIPAAEIAEEAEKHEMSFDTVKKLKDTLGIESVREGEKWVWVWTALL